MCRLHWSMLPTPLQQAVYREYREGQERSKDPSARYLAVAYHCIALVAEKEGYALQAAQFNEFSMEFREQTINDGTGDPLAFLEKP